MLEKQSNYYVDVSANIVTASTILTKIIIVVFLLITSVLDYVKEPHSPFMLLRSYLEMDEMLKVMLIQPVLVFVVRRRGSGCYVFALFFLMVSTIVLETNTWLKKTSVSFAPDSLALSA